MVAVRPHDVVLVGEEEHRRECGGVDGGYNGKEGKRGVLG